MNRLIYKITKTFQEKILILLRNYAKSTMLTFVVLSVFLSFFEVLAFLSCFCLKKVQSLFRCIYCIWKILIPEKKINSVNKLTIEGSTLSESITCKHKRKLYLQFKGIFFILNFDMLQFYIYDPRIENFLLFLKYNKFIIKISADAHG